ncbi:nuclear transcription factor Y subunit beta [Cladophialophora bantiana CBS 173.52]|uniref:Nuclear transcription factor Y subunit beta n=1 Tax=Cladophialophora bantiana (strain ATCC 10958 / CBS 173.52 / CDC B-1940 / NIH 8579) TaxID=1442370 RepID=A0A0D2I5E9_CLAB1|nr:nuclear transcription factor Y subunit beta [Cladophialophora bantiana CBS 173.52]KIW92124.1 nuclear transcription factor Y subunit beta [Cladophialophora bantiana CBS 173.52]
MSASPPKEPDVEQNAQSGEEQDHMDREQEGAQGAGLEFEVKEQDRWLPIANVARIMKTALPDNAKIAKEAKECMQECVSEFISFITSEASEKCQQEKRKTVNGEDILFAMTSLGFENYAEALKIYLSKYRETQSTRGENQNRPTSSGGYGGGVGAGNVQGNATTGPPGYPGGQADNAAELLNQGHGINANEHDATGPYGYPSAVSAGHNGITGDNF